MSTEVNINTMCTAVLTADGAKVVNIERTKMNQMLPSDLTLPMVQAGDTLREPMWKMFRLFGPMCLLGGVPMFRDGLICMDLDRPNVIEPVDPSSFADRLEKREEQARLDAEHLKKENPIAYGEWSSFANGIRTARSMYIEYVQALVGEDAMSWKAAKADLEKKAR
jgi:hypothetical protein